MLKKFCSILSAGVLLLSSILHGFTAQKNVYSNCIVAYAEDYVITKQQVESEIYVITKQQVESEMAFTDNWSVLDPEAKNQLWTETLNGLIEKEMIVKEFGRMKGQLPESCIQKKYEEVQKTRFDDDPLKLAEALHRQGESKVSYKARIKKEVIVSCMYERNVHKPNSVSPLDIQNYYQTHLEKFVQGRQFDIDQIIVKKEDTDTIASIQERLKEECSYEAHCQSLLQIPGINFSHMEAINESEVLPIIVEKITALPIDSFSDEFIELDGQIVLLGLRGIREARTLPINEVRESIERTLLGERYQKLRQEWLDQLKQKAYCVVL
jgi:hypothetical protein